MLSLPLIHPHETDSTWLRGSYQPRAESPPPVNGQTPHQTHRQRQLREGEKKQQHARSPLAILAAEEAAIRQRKAAVRGFGAQWIRPIGFPKTLQAQTEEELERLEMLEEQRRNQGLDDLQAQQQLLETQQQAQEHAAQAEAGEEDAEEEEVDLDAEIPDADASGADLTFNEESMLEGSQIEPAEREADEYAEMEEAELTGAARDEQDLDMDLDRDLDDSVPEAGSYQHTDTELEESDSESELQEDSFTSRSAARSARMPAPANRSSLNAPPMGGLQERMRAQVGAADSLPRSSGSLNLSSSILDSSMIGSSPVVQRNNGGTRGRTTGRRGRHS